MVKYEYTVKRSARRSVSVCVKDDNSILISAPLRMTDIEIERFLMSKSSWIDVHLTRNAVENEALSEIVNYKKILVAGKAVKLTVGENDVFSSDMISVKSLKNLKKLYVDNLGERFMLLFDKICKTNGFVCGKVDFKDYKAKWGCCDREGNIIFNYKLLMLPENLWRYIAAHELCHTVHMDHSGRFYSLLNRVLPSYKSDKKQLKNYSRLTRLY